MRRALALAVVVLLAPARAGAWTEARPISAEGHAVAREDGTADITYRVVFLIEAGWFRGFTLAGLPGDAQLDPTRCRAIDEQGAIYAVRVRGGTGDRRGSFWIDLDTRHGVGQGQLVVELAWTAALHVTRSDDGTVWEWETPPWSNGMNGVSASLDLPFPRAQLDVPADAPAEEDPEGEPLDPADGALEQHDLQALDEGHTRVTLSTFRLPRWTALRVRARVTSPSAGSTTARPTRPVHRRAQPLWDRTRAGALGAATALVLLLAFVQRWSTRRIARLAGAVAVDATLPGLGGIPRALLAGALVAGGLAVQATPTSQLAVGVAAILAAMVLLARRFERAVVARPPGQWIALAPEHVPEVLRAARARRRGLGSIFDATCPRGLFAFALASSAAVWGALHLRTALGWHAWALGLDALAVLLPLWLGATRLHLPRELAEASARMLTRHGRRAKRLLARCGGGEFSLLGRETGDGLDELRLELVPAQRAPGLESIQLGTEIWCGTPRLAAVIRAQAGSPADALARTCRGAVERHRSPDGTVHATLLVPGLDGHAGLFRDLRRALRALTKTAPPAAAPAAAPAAPTEGTERAAA